MIYKRERQTAPTRRGDDEIDAGPCGPAAATPLLPPPPPQAGDPPVGEKGKCS